MRTGLVLVAFLIAIVATFTLALLPSNDDGSNFNTDLVRTLNAFMCATGSEHCLDLEQGNIPWPVLKEKMTLRVLEWTHEMVNPRSVTHLAARHALPKDLQRLFATATKHYVAPVAYGLMSSAHKMVAQKAAVTAVRAAFAEMTGTKVGADKYAIFGMLPQWAGDAHIGSSTTFSTSCLGGVTVSATKSGANTIDVTTQPTHNGFLCSEMLLLLAGAQDFRIQIITKDGADKWSFSTENYQKPNEYYLARHGVRVLRFPKGLVETIVQLIATVETIGGFAEMPLTNVTLAKNIEFVRDYVEFNQARMGPKTVTRIDSPEVALAIEDQIQSGDALNILRPDGLDPMISWGQGWLGGHSVIAMRDSNNELWICESTVKDAYWPNNAIQTTKYAQWIKQANAAQFNVNWLPLAPEMRKQFDAAKAWEFFDSHKGVNYGYVNFIAGWMDTVKENFPCLPPDFKTCLDKEAAEQLALLVDRFSGDSNENIFRPMLNHRLVPTKAVAPNLPVIDVLMKAATELNKTFSDLYTEPELDMWLYNMSTNNGTYVNSVASVCCVFVCRMWKAGGMFNSIDSQINCAEQTLWDVYSFNIFDPARLGANRPKECVRADPAPAQTCQIMGSLTVQPKPDFNTRNLVTVRWPGQNKYCGATCPDYKRDPRC